MGVRLAYTACWVVIVALGVALVLAPVSQDPLAVQLVGALSALVGALFLHRSLRWATIDVGFQSVAVHDLFGTSRIAVGAIDRFLVVRSAYSSSEGARDLALRTREGKTIVFGDFSSDSAEAGFSVEALASRLNADIRAAAPAAQRAGAA